MLVLSNNSPLPYHSPIHCIIDTYHLLFAQCTLYNIQYTVYTVHCTMYSVHCTLLDHHSI